MYGPARRARPFRDRSEAGSALAAALEVLGERDPVLLALPRGGVPVAAEIAERLAAPLDVLIVRKVGAPGNPELGIGAVAEGGIRALDDDAIAALAIPPAAVDVAVSRAEAELSEGIERFRDGNPPLDLGGRTAIVVDDGLATGGTAVAAVEAVRQLGARRVVVAVPVGSREACDLLREHADEVVCLLLPSPLHAVGHWYDRFDQVDDGEVAELLGKGRPTGGRGSIPLPESVQIPIAGGLHLNGDLTVPQGAVGLVLFAHGSGSSRMSSRNRHVARVLQERGLATLLLDLLVLGEEGDRRKVFDIHLLAARLLAATEWASSRDALDGLPIGFFGASTGAGAALVAAAGRESVGAVVSRGGRPDLAGAALADVEAPVLLIVGGEDHEVLRLNRFAQERLAGPSRLAVVPGATHLFEEPGALDVVAALAADWFAERLQWGEST